jgi:hypothetical protein
MSHLQFVRGDSKHPPDPARMDQIVERYFRFMFALGWQTTEVLYTAGQSVPSLNAWRDVFFEEFED